MPRWLLAGLVGIPVVCIASICLMGLASGLWFTSYRPGSPASVLQAETPVPTTSVTMRANRFLPAIISVQVGDTITWTNTDSVQHNVIFRRNDPHSSLLNPAETFATTFATAGSYDYACSLHAGMVGRVLVRASG